MANQVAYGFHQLQDIFAKRVADMNFEVINDAIMLSASAYVEDFAKTFEALAEDYTGLPTAIVRLPATGELQPLSEDGVPELTRGGSSYRQSFPLKRGGTAFGYNREAWAKATVGDINEDVLRVNKYDAKWNIRHLLAAIFTNTPWTYKDEEYGNLTIKGLASGDTDQYVNQDGELGTADHYMAQVDPISDANNPFPLIHSTLMSRPENSGTVVAHIPTALSGSVVSLSGFIEYVSSSSLIEYGTNQVRTVGNLDMYRTFGKKVLGVVNDVVIVETLNMPATHLFAYSFESPKLVRRRIEPEAELQGFDAIYHKVNSNFQRWDWYRKAGYAVKNRVGAVAMQIGNAAYTIPAGYNASLLAG